MEDLDLIQIPAGSATTIEGSRRIAGPMKTFRHTSPVLRRSLFG